MESESLSTEPAERRVEKPLDYAEVVGKNDSVVFFGESHDNEGTLLELAAHATELKANGINAMLIEAPCDQDFTAINAGDFSGIDDLTLGPDLQMMYGYTTDQSLESIRQELAVNGDSVKNARQQLVMELVKAGIPVLPIDDPDYWEELRASIKNGGEKEYDPEELYRGIIKREDTASSNIQTYQSEYGELAVLIGKRHTEKDLHTLRDRPDLKFGETARRITELGISNHAVSFGTHIPTTLDSGSSPPKVPELDRFMYRDKAGILQVRVPVGRQEERIQMLELHK